MATVWHRGNRQQRQRGVVAIEFALMFLFGLLPLLLLTFSGVMTFAAKQALTLAAANGARAALRYPVGTTREKQAEDTAFQSMEWLLVDALGITSPQSPYIEVIPIACPSTPDAKEKNCIQVKTSTGECGENIPICYWLIGTPLTAQAVIQLPPDATIPPQT